jgi:hypothetical protein
MRCEMKKKILISLLVVSFFNYIGCYSYYSLTEEEINSGRPNSDDEIRLALKNSTKVDFGPAVTHFNNDGFYLNLGKPDSLLLGIGSIFNPNTGVKKNYKGIVEGETIDSSRIFYIDSKSYSVYWLKDHNRLSFEERYSAEILPGQGTGYFVFKPPYSLRRISMDEIKEIQISKINWYITVPFIVVGIAALIGLGIVGSNMEDWNLPNLRSMK